MPPLSRAGRGGRRAAAAAVAAVVLVAGIRQARCIGRGHHPARPAGPEPIAGLVQPAWPGRQPAAGLHRARPVSLGHAGVSDAAGTVPQPALPHPPAAAPVLTERRDRLGRRAGLR